MNNDKLYHNRIIKFSDEHFGHMVIQDNDVVICTLTKSEIEAIIKLYKDKYEKA